MKNNLTVAEQVLNLFDTKNKSVFDILNYIDCSQNIEKKNGANYLSWAYAWREVLARYPESTYEIKRWEGKPYFFDEDLGYWVETSMTIDGITRGMWLPVLNETYKAMKNRSYKYQVKEYKDRKWTGGYIDKTVEPATMFDINTALMRCLVKNIAMFGLGLYIYAGEDIPGADIKEMAIQYFQLKRELEDLGCDFEDPEIIEFIQKYAHVENIDIQLTNLIATNNLIECFKALLASKKSSLKKEKKSQK